MTQVKNILVVRFRQMGDAILSTALLNTLRATFPEARIDFVLNSRIANLFEGHPSIDRIITFTDEERHSFFTFTKKVWRIVHDTRYDVIIDMRSTANTMLFGLFSPSTPYRIGLDKGYTWMAFNKRIKADDSICRVDFNVSLAAPLEAEFDVKYTKEFTLQITEEEKQNYVSYLVSQGVDLQKPLLLANVTAKLAHKVWQEDRMAYVLSEFISEHPDVQIIFNYAPGEEETNARRIYQTVGSPSQVLIDVKAKSPRELCALSGVIALFFGNEGGARHIAHAAGAPSLVVCAPGNSKTRWLPQTSVPATGIAPADYATAEELAAMSREQQYALIKKEDVLKALNEAYRKALGAL